MVSGTAPAVKQSWCDPDVFEHHFIKSRISRVAREYDMPYCCIAVDCGDRLVLKAKHGLLPSVVVTAPGGDACLARISARRRLPKIVYDALTDGRYTHDPLVKESPGVRFFIGIPILLPSWKCIGILCLMSPQPTDYYSLNDCELLLSTADAIAEQCCKLVTQQERAEATMSAGAMRGSFQTFQGDDFAMQDDRHHDDESVPIGHRMAVAGALREQHK